MAMGTCSGVAWTARVGSAIGVIGEAASAVIRGMDLQRGGFITVALNVMSSLVDFYSMLLEMLQLL